jgi:hypothetical protein
MLIYWVLYGLPSLFGLIEQGHERRRHRVTFLWLMWGLLIACLIGFRWKTGGDWGNYYNNLRIFYWEEFSLLLHRDVGYAALSYFAAQFQTGIIVITLFSGLVMGMGLVLFCLNQPRPWLCLAVAIPYLVIVCGMGYVRQGIAISFLMIGLVALKKDRTVSFTGWALLGALFHGTAVLFVPLAFLFSARNKGLMIVLGLITAVAAYTQVLAPRAEVLLTNYVQQGMESSGALVRLAMTALPAAIFLIARNRFDFRPTERKVWTAMSALAIALFLAFPLASSSTVLDRLGLYLLPVQAFVYANCPDAFGRNKSDRQLISVAILSLYTLAFFVWINFASHAHLWTPYRFYFFEDGICLECGDPNARET